MKFRCRNMSLYHMTILFEPSKSSHCYIYSMWHAYGVLPLSFNLPRTRSTAPEQPEQVMVTSNSCTWSAIFLVATHVHRHQFKQLCRINTKHGMQIADQATEKLSNWAGKKPEVPKAANPLWLLEGNLLLPTFIPSIWNVTDSPCRRKHKKWKSMQ